MRTLLTPRLHGVLDYVTVAIFALAPAVLGLTGLAATMSYVLAGVHLAMTLATDFPLGIARLVPFRVHGVVEAVVTVALAAAGLLLFDGTAQGFYFVMAAIIALVWFTTDYTAAA